MPLNDLGAPRHSIQTHVATPTADCQAEWLNISPHSMFVQLTLCLRKQFEHGWFNNLIFSGNIATGIIECYKNTLRARLEIVRKEGDRD